ncbi:MAG: hypothetical protein OJF59_002148 [Cytophagales bacterium]|nr:MAG: hypothetical protein OJF59_002148 [Cytophagales bacterium]
MQLYKKQMLKNHTIEISMVRVGLNTATVNTSETFALKWS